MEEGTLGGREQIPDCKLQLSPTVHRMELSVAPVIVQQTQIL